MTDIGELTKHVETNPNDHDHRWHLAKKLYTAGEYRSALGHLLVLQTNWTPKVNVTRYLAATYYRLERYDEAISELRAGIEEWPEEIPLREQLARVLEVSGRYEEAIAAWEALIRQNPNNSMAKRLLKKLREAKPGQGKDERTGPESRDVDAGIGAAVGGACPSCGAQNSEEFDRCWKCHTPLATYGMPDFDSKPPAPTPPSRPPQWPVLYILCGVAAVAILCFGGYLSIPRMMALRGSGENPATVCSVREVFNSDLLHTRIATGLMLLVVWPVVLWLATVLMQPELAARGPILVGILMASIGYLTFWSAPSEMPYVFLSVLFLAVVPIMGVLRLRFLSAMAVWLVQAAVVMGSVLASVCALEGVTFLMEFPALIHYAEVHDDVRNYGGEVGRLSSPSLYIPVDTNVRWESTGSTWLDKKAKRADFEIASDAPIPGLTIEIKDQTGTAFYNHATAARYKFTFDKVAPGASYKLLITGQENAKLDVTVRGLMNARFVD